jgi:hypothetical protein
VNRSHGPCSFQPVDETTWRIEPTDALRAPGIIYADESLIRDAEAGDNTCARYRIVDFSFIVSPSRLRATSLVDTH